MDTLLLFHDDLGPNGDVTTGFGQVEGVKHSLQGGRRFLGLLGHCNLHSS